MYKMVLKSLLIGLIGVSFSACANSNSHAQDSVSAHHSKILKKKRMQRFEARKLQRAKETAQESGKKSAKKSKKNVAKKSKFCFKSSSSIHYRSSERCK